MAAEGIRVRSVASLLIVLLGGAWAFGWATDGYTTLSSEQARRNAVAREPVSLPHAQVVLHDGTHVSTGSLLANRAKSTLVTFVYTRCTAICVALGYEFKQLQEQIIRRGLSDQVQLLSISFDPEHDTPEALTGYARRMRADPSIWSIGTITDEDELHELLDSFGITVIRDELGGFQHNAAYHVVDAGGQLTAIVDLAQPELALQRAMARRRR